MEFLTGDPVIHWTYGLGKIVRQEERTFSGVKKLYYAVQIRDLTVWVPADAKVMSRQRIRYLCPKSVLHPSRFALSSEMNCRLSP
jgi:RNA polymerase-interacting CarD/CdnL/TRCF family regulator